MYLWWEEAEAHIEVGYPDIVTIQKKEPRQSHQSLKKLP